MALPVNMEKLEAFFLLGLFLFFFFYWFSLAFRCDRRPESSILREMVIDDGGCAGWVGSMREMKVLRK